MGQVFDLVQVGQDEGDFVALLDLELAQAVGRRLGNQATVTLLPLRNTPESFGP